MSRNKTNLTECEQLVMKVIWNSEAELTLPDIVRKVNSTYQKEWKPQTVSTFLARLVKKGFLNSYRAGRTFYYQSLISEKTYGNRMIENCVEFWSNNNAGDLLCALNEERKLRSDEVEKIKSLIDELD